MQGQDVFQISHNTGIKIAELWNMAAQYSPALYQLTLIRWLDKMLEAELKSLDIYQAGSMDKLKEIIASRDLAVNQVEADQDITAKYMQELSERAKADRVLWSKLPTLNRLTYGIKRKTLTTIAARPSEGKSAFGLQAVLGIAEAGKKVLYFPLEMSNSETIDRILAHKRIAALNETALGKVPGKKMNDAADYLRNLEKSDKLKFYEGAGDIESIEEAINREQPFAVAIDQLSLMRSSTEKFGSIRERFSYMTVHLKRIAMQYNVAVILLCQLRRDAQERRPTLADLKESGSIEEDSDNVIMLYRVNKDYISNPEKIDWENTRPVIIIVAKQRGGIDGEFKAMFKPAEMLFYEEALPYSQDHSAEHNSYQLSFNSSTLSA